MTIMKLIKKIFYITERQDTYLKKIKGLSFKSEAALMREAIELLIRTPGKQI